MAARVAQLAEGKYRRDIAKICPKCKTKGALRVLARIHQYADEHSHQTDVGHGKKKHKETVRNTMHHFSAFYRCEKCGHEFQHDYKRFVMNNPSFDKPHDLMIGLLRMILQI